MEHSNRIPHEMNISIGIFQWNRLSCFEKRNFIGIIPMELASRLSNAYFQWINSNGSSI